ncbi:unnamed protein product [Cutaneotrichosporon oleaginosum]
MHPALLLSLFASAVVAEPTGWNWACRPDLAVCSRCTITWTGASAPVSAKVVNAAGDTDACVLSATGDSCVWSVDLPPRSIASVVVTSNGTDYSHILGQVGCHADCPAYANVCSQPSSSTSSSSSTSTSDSTVPSSFSSSPSTTTSSPSTSASTSETTSQQTSQTPAPSQSSEAPKPDKVKTTTKVSTAPPTQLTTTDEQGRTTTIIIPGAVTTNITTVDEGPNSGLSTGAVAAIASVSSIAGLALIIGGWYACRRSRRHNDEIELEDSILFGLPQHPSSTEPFFASRSDSGKYDGQEVLGSPSQRTSGYTDPYAPYGAGIASTFPTRYTDGFSEPNSPVMRPSSRTSAPNSPVLVPRSRSQASLDRLSRPSSLVQVAEPAISGPPPRYNDDVAEFVTIGTPVTMRTLVPGPRHAQGAGGVSDRPRSWVDVNEHRRSMNHEQMVTSVAQSRGLRDFDATQPLLKR